MAALGQTLRTVPKITIRITAKEDVRDLPDLSREHDRVEIVSMTIPQRIDEQRKRW
jgi:hypothetical protein